MIQVEASVEGEGEDALTDARLVYDGQRQEQTADTARAQTGERA